VGLRSVGIGGDDLGGWRLNAISSVAQECRQFPLSTLHGTRSLPCLCRRALRAACFGVLGQGQAPRIGDGKQLARLTERLDVSC
jgi:hypothetical protein